MNTENESGENRIITIETKIAYQEDLLQQLNDIVSLQQKKLDQLEATCRSLIDGIASLTEADGNKSTANQRPPHY